MTRKTNARLAAILILALCTGLLSGCASPSESDAKSPSAPVARIDDDGTTLLSEMDTTDESNFIVQYQRENFTVYDRGIFHVLRIVSFIDGYLLFGDHLTGPEISGDELDEITPRLCKIDAAGNLAADYSDAVVLHENYSLSLVGTGIDCAYLSYKAYQAGGAGSDQIIARLDEDGIVTELFPIQLDSGYVHTLVGTEDKLYVFISLTENGQNKTCIQQYDLAGRLLQSNTTEETIHRVYSCRNKIYIQSTAVPSRVDEGAPLVRIFLLIPEDLSFSPVTNFDSGSLVACDENSLYMQDSTSFYRYHLETQETELLFNTAELGVRSLQAVIPIDGGGFIGYDPSTVQIFFLRELLSTDAIGRKQIVLGTTNTVRSYTNAVLAFNSSQSEYKIVIHDYTKYQDPELILNTEIIAGNGPDILDMVNLSGDMLKAGVLTDLLPYMVSDPDIDTDDFFPAVFEAMKVDGKVMSAIPTYLIYSLVAREDDYPAGIDGMDGFLTAVSKNGLYYQNLWSQEAFLQCAFCSDTIDHYTQSDIADILRLSANLTTEEEQFEQDGFSAHEREFAAGRQDLFVQKFGGTDSVIIAELALQTRLKPLGFPFAEENTGMIIPMIELGVLSNSEVKDGAWAFIRTMFLPEYQRMLGNMTYPLSQSAYANAESEYRARWEEKGYWVTVAFADRSDEVFLDRALGLECARKALEKPYGVYHYNEAVMGFVNVAAQEYYNGKLSAEGAAELVMSKLKIYFAERE